jgi:hypothetical protein
MFVRALIAAFLAPALGAAAALGVLQAMAAYTGAALSDVTAACAPAGLALFLSPECEPVQPHYWLLLFSAATAAAGLGLIALRLIGGRTDWSVFSFRGLMASLVVAAHWVILIAAAYIAQQQWLADMPATALIMLAAPAAGLALWLAMSALRLRAD